MDEEPFDSLGYGSRPQMPRGVPPTPPADRDPPAIRTLPTSGPPTSAFRSNSRSDSAFNASGRAISTGHSSSFSRTSSNGGNSAFEDDDMEDEDRSVDEYDNNRIRQEALRMLEVAEAGDSKFSVHRTATGGFTAQPRELGSQRGRTALTGLNFVAQRGNTGKRYADFAVSSAARDDYEYGDESVVDRNGLEKRSAESESRNKSSWSSRYAIDKTVLAMSGGAMRSNRRSHTDPERLSALNLFNSSPTKKSQVFGSGFSFRQKHVFGKQNVSMDMRNLHNNEGPIQPSKNAKSWQEQLVQKNRQRRRMLAMATCLLLFLVLVPTFSVYGVRRAQRFPADGKNGSVTFGVTSNGPYENSDLFRQQIIKSNEKSSFTVHLGNVQKVEDTSCEAWAYEEAVSRLHDASEEPIFIVPGERDWNDCPFPEDAWTIWYDQFLYFDRYWDTSYNDDPEEREFLVFRQREQRENWAFLRNNVLFIGVHVVNGVVPSQEEFDERNGYNFDWVSGLAKTHHDSIHSVVIFGNASPGRAENVYFFAPLEDYWRDFDLPALYVHSTEETGYASKAYHPFKDLKNFMATSVNPADGSQPLLINVNGGSTPFRLN